MSAAGLERPRSPLVPVHRLKVNCPVCGKPDNCAVSADGQVAYCRRVRSDRQGADGGWTHFLTGTQAVAPAPPMREPERQPRAPLDHLDGVYSTLLRGHLTLNEAHREALRARGLSDSEIDRNGYRSTPSPHRADEIADALSVYGLEGVPGFRRAGGRFRMIGTPPGIIIPYRDERGRIQGLQHRPDVTPEHGGKYRWLSSRECSSGAPPHFACRHLLPDARELVVTEGALKADVIAYFTQAPVVAVAGVSTFGRDFAARLSAAAPNLGRVLVAYDRDILVKPEVLGACERLTAQLLGASFDVRVRTWPGEQKGYDDYLLARHLLGKGVRAA